MPLFSCSGIYAGLLARLFPAQQSCGFTSRQVILLRHQAFFSALWKTLQVCRRPSRKGKVQSYLIQCLIAALLSNGDFVSPFWPLHWSEQASRTLPVVYPMSPGKQCTGFPLPVFVLLPASHSLRTVAPIHRQGFGKPIEFSKLILYCYFYYISIRMQIFYRVFRLSFLDQLFYSLLPPDSISFASQRVSSELSRIIFTTIVRGMAISAPEPPST